MITKETLTVTVDTPVIKTIEERRGDVGKSRFVNKILREALGLNKK